MHWLLSECKEVFNWIYFSEEEKMKILLELKKRKERKI